MSDVQKPDTIVVSLRLKPELAEAFRTEAARRNTRLVRLFEEMWQLYVARRNGTTAAPWKRK